MTHDYKRNGTTTLFVAWTDRQSRARLAAMPGLCAMTASAPDVIGTIGMRRTKPLADRGDERRTERCECERSPLLRLLCACGHDTAAPPRSLRTSLRLMGAPPSSEDALRVRAGSLGIKASLAGGRRASAAQGAHGRIGSSCDRDVETLLPRGRWRSQGTPGSRMFYDPQTAFGLVVLGLLCVAVFYVAARSP
jgi:hypothetical protein